MGDFFDDLDDLDDKLAEADDKQAEAVERLKQYLSGDFSDAANVRPDGDAAGPMLVHLLALSMTNLDAAADLLYADDDVALGSFREFMSLCFTSLPEVKASAAGDVCTNCVLDKSSGFDTSQMMYWCLDCGSLPHCRWCFAAHHKGHKSLADFLHWPCACETPAPEGSDFSDAPGAAHLRLLQRIANAQSSIGASPLSQSQLDSLRRCTVPLPLQQHWLEDPSPDADSLLVVIHGHGQGFEELRYMAQASSPPPTCNVVLIEADVPVDLPPKTHGFVDGRPGGRTPIRLDNVLAKTGERILFANRLLDFLASRKEPNLHLLAFSMGCAVTWQVLMCAEADIPLRRVALLSGRSMSECLFASDDTVRTQLSGRSILFGYGQKEEVQLSSSNEFSQYKALADRLFHAAPPGAVKVVEYPNQGHTMTPQQLDDVGKFLFP